MIGLIFIAICTTLAMGLPVFGAQDEVRVAVTIKPIHSLVSSLMAGVGRPTLLVQGAASPHVFALKPSDARDLGKSGVFVRVSPVVEPFTDKIMKNLPSSAQVVTLVDVTGITRLSVRDDEDFVSDPDAHDAGHEHGSQEDGVDGHIWLDPDNAKVIAIELATVFTKTWPVHADKFDENAKRLLEKLDSLAVDVSEELASVKDRRFVVFHDAFQYFETYFGLKSAGAITVRPEVPPGAQQLVRLRQRIVKLKAACVFAEPQFRPRIIHAVQEGTGVRAGMLDPLGASLKPGPELYFQLMNDLARGFKTCLSQ